MLHYFHQNKGIKEQKMSLAFSEKYTAKDYQNWEGDWELIAGRAYAMSPSPFYDQQYINLKIARQLDEQLDDCPKCHAVIEMDVTLAEDTVVRPDSMVICYEPDKKLTKAPRLVFEVLSKSTARKDEILKFDLYQSEGVKYYVLVYPEAKKAELYQLVDFNYRKIGDFTDEHYCFDLEDCDINFDFSFIGRK